MSVVHQVRPGFTLAESLVAIVLSALVVVAVGALELRQGTAAGTALARAAARAQLAAARAALEGELAAVMHGESRLTVVHDTLLELDAHVGMALSCRPAAAGARTLIVAAHGAAGALPASGWLRAAAPGDSVAVFDPSNGRWESATLVSVATGSCSPGVLAGPGRLLALAAPGTPVPVPEGAPVVVHRHVRWTSYRAADGRWYLGVREQTSGAWAIVQPVAGPLDASAGQPRPFALLDDAGVPLAPGAPIALGSRLEVVLDMADAVPADRVPLVVPVRRRP